MAKVPFTKLKCKVNINTIPVQIGDEVIGVKQYLPIQEKLALISNVVNQAHMQDENYSNPVKAGVFTILEMVYAYADIGFTDKQKEDPAKLYDMMKCSGILDIIISNIPEDERTMILTGVDTSIEAVYKYRNSILGILDTLKTDYSNIDMDLAEMAKSIDNPEVLNFVKGLVDKVN